MQLYFDNAATSFPKPDVAHEAIEAYVTQCGASPGRGAYHQAANATALLERCRELLCELVNAPSPKRCIFTLNCTDALNLAISGIARHFLQKGETVHIVTTVMSHNSVLRPLHALEASGVTHTIVQADAKTGLVDPEDIRAAIMPSTKLVAIAHGSNVTGTIQNIEAIGAQCKDIPFLVDAAQTMGHIPIDVQKMDIDLLAFPGHKGLLGPLGTGGLIIKPGIEEIITPLRTGGTGSESEYHVQPETLPDKFEAGSHNMLGIAGLLASVRWILTRGVATLHEIEQTLSEQFIHEIKKIDGVRIIGPQTTTNRCGVFSLAFEDAPHDIAKRLEENSGICVRSGLHCAPFAHKTMGTDSIGGTVRISFGPFNTSEDISFLVQEIANTTEKVLS